MILPTEKIKYCRFPKLIIFQCIYHYLRYSLSYRDIEEIMKERGISVDHSTIQDWVVRHAVLFEKSIHKKKRTTKKSWRMDETYIKVNGKWKYLYRAVDEDGDTIDFLLTARRDTRAAKRFLQRAIKNNGTPEKVTIDGSASNKKALIKMNKQLKQEGKEEIEIQTKKYLNNIVEQDHRGIKRITNAMLGFKNFHSAQKTIRGIEIVRMIKKGQILDSQKVPFHTFCALAA